MRFRNPSRSRRRGVEALRLIDALESRLLLTDVAPPSGNATAFIEEGNLYVEGASGTSVSMEADELVVAPWPTLTHLFDKLVMRGEGGEDRLELEDVRVTDDAFTAYRRGKAVGVSSGFAIEVQALANSVFPTGDGLPVRVRSEPDSEGSFIVVYPTRSADFYTEGRPRVRANIISGTAVLMERDGGRERPVEFVDIELDDSWWRGLPN